MIDLILWAANKAALRTFAINRGLLLPAGDTGGNEFVPRKGFSYVWWRDSGKFETQMRTEWATDTIDQEDTGLGRVGINVGATPPAWVEDPLQLVNTDGATVADFNLIQGNFAVFDVRAGETVAVGEPVTAVEPTQFITGVVALCRIHGKYYFEDRITDTGFSDTGDPDQIEQWSRSRVARAVKRNGVFGTINGIPYYEWDGVRIFRAIDVQTYLSSNGIPRHIWMGGNRY